MKKSKSKEQRKGSHVFGKREEASPIQGEATIITSPKRWSKKAIYIERSRGHGYPKHLPSYVKRRRLRYRKPTTT